jgi:hypothetical protein
VTAKLQQVHIRVNDAATGKPTPCRIRITDAENTYYAPYGRLTKFAAGPGQTVGGDVYLGIRPHAYIDGACEIALPTGSIRVEINKGPEYQPLNSTVDLVPGKLSLRFELKRWTDLRDQGWFSGDCRAHSLSPHAALLEAQAEDLAIVNLLAEETTLKDSFGEAVKAITNLLAFSGQEFALSAPGCGVAVNTLNRHPVLGTLALLHCHRVVYPLTFGGEGGKEDWTLADWCDQCHRKAGLVVWARTADPQAECGHGEALADLILGKIDAFELDHFDGSPFDGFADWKRLLDAGIMVTLVGASGKNSNGRALGVLRTYARLGPGEPLTLKGWIEAVRAGRSFVTNGPLVSLEVDGVGPSVVPLDREPGASFRLQAEARSWLAFDELVVLNNGKVIERAAPSAGPPYHAAIQASHPVRNGGWLTAGCFGQQAIADRPANQTVFACTSAVYLRTPYLQNGDQATAQRRWIAELDASVEWVETRARCETPKQRERLANVFLQAKQKLASL